jgi:hypothetical protein
MLRNTWKSAVPTNNTVLFKLDHFLKKTRLINRMSILKCMGIWRCMEPPPTEGASTRGSYAALARCRHIGEACMELQMKKNHFEIRL